MTTSTPRRPVAAALLTGFVAALLALAPSAGADPDTDNGYNGAPIGRSGGPTPSLAGIPCVGSHFGACTSIAQNQPGVSSPTARIGSGR